MKNTLEISNLSDFISKVSQLQAEKGSKYGDRWFRGVNDSSLGLLPGVKWRGLNERQESTIISEFTNSSPSLTHEKPENEWQKYALMQHYGLPTRLLDWTKSPLIALYFALWGDVDRDRTIWCIEPFELNSMSHGKETIFTPDSMDEDDGVDIVSYLPKQMRKNKSISIPRQPIAIEPPFSNRRILAQQGCFTVHGAGNDPIETLYEKSKPNDIHQFLIKRENSAKFRNELFEFGVREETVFPDLNSLSQRIIREFCQNHKTI